MVEIRKDDGKVKWKNVSGKENRKKVHLQSRTYYDIERRNRGLLTTNQSLRKEG